MRRSSSKPLCGEAQGGVGVGEDGAGIVGLDQEKLRVGAELRQGVVVVVGQGQGRQEIIGE